MKDKRRKKMTAGRVERGKKMAADGGSPSTRTRKRLFDLSKVETGKTVETVKRKR